MTQDQNSKIINYLLSKKLPIDVLVEIYDHFVSQIHDLKNEMNFEEAFENAKKEWSQDLGFAQDAFTGLDGTKFTNKLNWQIQKGYFKKGLRFAVFPFVIIGLLASILPLNFFESTLYSLIGLYIIVLVFLMVKQHKLMYKTIQKYDNYNLSIYRSQGLVLGGLGGILPAFGFNAFKVYDMYHDLFALHISWSTFFFAIITLFILTLSPMIFFNYRDLKKSFYKIQPFLEYLTPNRFYAD